MNYNRNNYYNNYFDYNKESINIIQEYISLHSLSGHIYTDVKKYEPYLIPNEINEKNCYIEKCNVTSNIIQIFKNMNLNYLSVHGDTISMKTKRKLYGLKENELYYAVGYYVGKKEGEVIDNNSMHKIIKIFDNDWGIVNWCYGCGGGGWD
ncbi:MAG: hypothetical protein GY828_06055 [Candidatus Gracilibacteria bacterium]|nr:hypothetical protein [Candidatus Gracilibacteria bacterium]